MKTRQLISVALAAMLLLACTKNEDEPGKEAGKSKLTISLKGEQESTAPVSRAAGTPTTAEESTISDFIIYVFKGDDTNDINPKAVAVSTVADLTVTDLEITTDARQVYVVANTAATSTLQTSLLAVTQKSELQALTGRLFVDATSTGASSQTKDNLWMSGQTAISPTYGGNVTAPVILSFVPARLCITKVAIDNSKLANLSTDLVLNEITVFNAGSESKLIPDDGATSLIPTSMVPSAAAPFYTAGADMIGMSSLPTLYGKNDGLTLALTGSPASVDATNNPNYFYVFENDGVAFESKPTIITLKATYQTSRVVYYSVLFKLNTPTEPGFEDKIIERGKSYNIAMTIKKLGNSDPTLPALKTSVDITITPAAWVAVPINKTYD